MLPRSQELLNMHSSGCICAYAASPAIAVMMGNSVVPSVASRENKAVRRVWKLGGHPCSTARNGGNLSMLTQAQKRKPRALSIPAGGLWASINLSGLSTAQINWSSELLKLKSCTRRACCWILNRTICNKPYPQQAISPIPFKGWAFTSHTWLLGKGLSLHTVALYKKVHSYALIHDSAAQENGTETTGYETPLYSER